MIRNAVVDVEEVPGRNAESNFQEVVNADADVEIAVDAEIVADAEIVDGWVQKGHIDYYLFSMKTPKGLGTVGGRFEEEVIDDETTRSRRTMSSEQGYAMAEATLPSR
jgi:hypothetical protein